jgi:protein phosphatase
MTQLRSAALSDIGRVRRQNEDRCLCDERLQVYGVADGVGGLPGGAEAAQKAVEVVLHAVATATADTGPDLARIVDETNRQVRALGATLSPVLGLGCTLTFGQVRGSLLTIAHVGDSRCYSWRRGEFVQLTDDHSVENEARLRRAQGEVVYYHESDRNALTRCIGQPGNPKVDVIRRQLRAGDRYLFCTDGITRVVRDAELEEAVSTADDPPQLLQQLVALAIRRGGPDNASGVALFVDDL